MSFSQTVALDILKEYQEVVPADKWGAFVGDSMIAKWGRDHGECDDDAYKLILNMNAIYYGANIGLGWGRWS